MRFLAVILMLCFGVVGPLTAQKPCPIVSEAASDPQFKPGQVWSYRTRRGEDGSTLTILRVERWGKVGIIVHIRLDGLAMRNPRGEIVPSIEHMPFSRDAMLMSVARLLRATETLPTMEGYERWKADCGGVYTISVADAVTVADKTFNQP